MPQLTQQSLTDPYAGDPVEDNDPSLSDPYAGEPAQVKGKAQRFGESFVRNVLPSTRAADYVEGPLYAAQHPLDALGLIVNAFIDSHKQQAGKTLEAGKRIFTAPNLQEQLFAVDETLGHGLATVLPMIGPAAANAGEQIGSGDVAGGLGATAGLLTPSAVAAAAPHVTPLVRKATAPIADALHNDALTRVGKALAPTTRENKARTARIAPEILKRRVTARTLPKLEEIAAEKSAVAGANVEQALQPHAQTPVSVLPMVQELEQAKAPYIGQTTTGGAVVNDAARVKAIQKLQDTLTQYGSDISVESLTKLRRNWDEVVEAGKGFTTPKPKLKAWAAREGRSVIRDELNQYIPNLDKVNAEYSFWQTLEDVASATVERRRGQKGDLTSSIAGAAGAVIGGAKGGPIGVAIGAKAFASLKKFLDSPGYQLWSAVQKERLADALMAKDAGRVQGLIHQGMVAASKTSRNAGRLQSGRPTPKSADATDQEPSPPRSARDKRQ